MSIRLSAIFAIAALILSACMPIPIIVPLSASGQPVSDQPVQRLGETPPQSAAVDAALNKARTSAGSASLVSNSGLDRVAAQYAADLAQGDKLMMGLPTGARG
jgi:uncharacterized protein YkwD